MNPESPKSPYVLALASSPSRGFNSDSMLDAFIDGAKSQGVNVEKLYVYDLDVAFYEFANRVPLPEEKDILMVADKIKNAQGLVIATPTWNFGIPGKLKNIYDRLGFIGLDYKTMNKLGQPTGQLTHLKTFFLVSGGSPNWVRLFLFPIFPTFWLRVAWWYYGAHRGGSIYGGSLQGKHTSKSDIGLMTRCRNAGVRFAKSLE